MFNLFKKKKFENKESPKAFIILGRSGCGKGTQADLLMSHLHNSLGEISKTLHIESGALLRNFAKGNNYTQKKIKDALGEGVLIPESIVVALWTDLIIANFNGTENMVFDGAPRKIHEAQLLDNALQFYGIEKPNVIYVNVSKEWAEQRLQGRARKDDTRDAITKRQAWFETEVMKTIEFYRNSPYYNFIDINGEQSVEQVQNEILAKLGLNR
jgi:adenylate kinase family enzyme